jgi:nucleoside-diphosphate-sugar epimerase
MTILVTGASGFLGGALSSALIRNGEQVRALVRPTSNLRYLEKLPLELQYGSLEDQASVCRAAEGVSIIYHCAATSADWAPWKTFYSGNVTGVRNLLEAASRQDALQRFVHVSTTDVYGYPVRACDETHPIVDVGLPYNRTKGQGERIVWEFYDRVGLPITVVRPANMYGPRDKNFVVEAGKLLLERQVLLINGGQSTAGLLYVDNAVEGIIKAAHSANTVGRAYNLRDGTDESWQEYFNALADSLGAPRPRLNLSEGTALAVARAMEAIHSLFHIQHRPLLTRHIVYVLSRDQGYPIDRAKRDFGFSCSVSFAEGIARSLAWLDSEEGRIAVPR